MKLESGWADNRAWAGNFHHSHFLEMVHTGGKYPEDRFTFWILLSTKTNTISHDMYNYIFNSPDQQRAAATRGLKIAKTKNVGTEQVMQLNKIQWPVNASDESESQVDQIILAWIIWVSQESLSSRLTSVLCEGDG